MSNIKVLNRKLDKLGLEIAYAFECRKEIAPEDTQLKHLWGEKIDNLWARYAVLERKISVLQSIIDHNLEVVANFQL